MRKFDLIRGLAIGGTAAAVLIAAGPAVRSEPRQSAALDRYYGQDLDWGSCEMFGDTGIALDADIPRVECARLTVPLDYADPDGETAEIALSRVPASGDKIGSLVVNPGGPGESGLGYVAVGNGTDIAERFDRVGFDPRGMGASTPLLQCHTAAEIDALRAENNPEPTEAEIEAAMQAFVDACVENSGLGLLANIGTRDVVRDLDILRAALGDERLTYLGYSYGTSIGGLYAEAYPDRVRAMVLDGAVDPSKVLLTGFDEGFTMAYADYFAACTAAPGCPLGSDPARAEENFDALLQTLIERPAATASGRELSYTDAALAVGLFMYSSASWPVLTEALTQVAAGRGDILLEAADFVYGRRADGTYGNRQEMITAVQCVDSSGALPPACAIWPVPATNEPHEITVDVPPIVVVSTTNDPATPHENGVSLARQLDGVLISYDAIGHTIALTGVACVDDPVISYLADLTVPTTGIVCSSA